MDDLAQLARMQAEARQRHRAARAEPERDSLAHISQCLDLEHLRPKDPVKLWQKFLSDKNVGVVPSASALELLRVAGIHDTSVPMDDALRKIQASDFMQRMTPDEVIEYASRAMECGACRLAYARSAEDMGPVRCQARDKPGRATQVMSGELTDGPCGLYARFQRANRVGNAGFPRSGALRKPDDVVPFLVTQVQAGFKAGNRFFLVHQGSSERILDAVSAVASAVSDEMPEYGEYPIAMEFVTTESIAAELHTSFNNGGGSPHARLCQQDLLGVDLCNRADDKVMNILSDVIRVRFAHRKATVVAVDTLKLWRMRLGDRIADSLECGVVVIERYDSDD